VRRGRGVRRYYFYYYYYYYPYYYYYYYHHVPHLRLEQTSHILDGQNMDTQIDQLTCEFQIVV